MMVKNISHFLFCMIVKGKTVQLTLIRDWVFDVIFGQIIRRTVFDIVDLEYYM